MKLLGFGNEKLPSVINDPFDKNNIESIHVWFSRGIISGKMSATGKVEFKNGDTSGEQMFRAATFDEVVLQIKAMLDNMDK